MPSTLIREAEQDWSQRDVHFKRRLRPSLERLRTGQLRDGSLYSNLRAFVPVVVLLLAWLRLVHWTPGANVNMLLSLSITGRHLLLAVGIVALWNTWLGLTLYMGKSLRKDLLAEVYRLGQASAACGGVLLVWEVCRGLVSRGVLLFALTSLPLFAISIVCLSLFYIAAMFSPRLLRRRSAIIVGSGPRAELLKSSLHGQYSPIQIFGCVDNEYMGSDARADGYLGPISKLAELLKAHPIETVLIGLPIRSKYDEIQQVIEVCEAVGVESQYLHDMFETARVRVQAHPQVPSRFNVLSASAPDPKQHIKRALDFITALILLVIASPLLLIVAIAIRCTSPGPILFVQERYGRHRKQFPMFKFRSMVVDAEKRQAALESQNEAQGPVFKLKRDPRVTRLGSFLRKTSIDELPQLFNVLRGEMSLVGPRPLPLRDVSKFDQPWLLRRFSVRPGLTCIWQVSGRSNTTFDEWMRQDLSYIDNWSLALDCSIMIRTVPAVLRGSGAV